MIEKAIHEILNRPLPAGAEAINKLRNRLYTGMMQDGVIPYATVNKDADTNVYRSNESSTFEASLRFKVFDDDHQRGAAIRDALVKLLENQSFDTSELLVKSCRKQNDFAAQESDGLWQFVLDFDLKFEEK